MVEAEHEEDVEEEVEPGSLPDSARVSFPCDECGADLAWDPDRDALACEHCGSVRPVPRAEAEIVEHALADAGAAARGLGLEVRVTRCETCGAQVAFDQVETSKTCVFCGSSAVLAQAANRNALRPESLVPLDVGRDAVEANFRKWLRGLWFRPSALKRQRTFHAVGVYVPHWTFDCRVHSDWSADAGYYYYVTRTYTTTVNGKRVRRTRRVRKVRWVPAWGSRDDAYDDVLVNASAGIPDELAGKLGPFDMSSLVPYQPQYLAGWRAEEYQLDLEGGWDGARGRVVEEQRRRCAGDVPGDTQRDLQVRNAISAITWKHVLLPIWSLSYTFRGKTYTVLVHGQTGRTVGKAPWSFVKILLFVLAILALAGAIALVVVATR